MKQESIAITDNPNVTLNSADAFRAELAKLSEAESNTEQVEVQNDDISETQVEESQETEEHSNTEVEQVNDSKDIEDDEDDEDDQDGYVPRKRLNKEIRKRKVIAGQLEAEHEERIRAKTELDLINQAIEKMRSNEVNDTASEIEPLDQDMDKVYKKEFDTLKKEIKGLQESLDLNTKKAMFEQKVNAQSAQFAKEHPDFTEAIQYFIQSEVEKEKLITPEKEAHQAVLQKILEKSWMAYNNDRNVAETLYKMAKISGYNKQSTKAAPNLDAINTNMRKSKSINDIPAASVPPSNGGNNYTVLKNMDKLMSENGKGLDEKKFRQALNAIQNRNNTFQV